MQENYLDTYHVLQFIAQKYLKAANKKMKVRFESL